MNNNSYSKEIILNSLKYDNRIDNRKRLEIRDNIDFNLNKEIMPNSNSSCIITIKNENIKIYISIIGEIEQFNENNTNDLVEINFNDSILNSIKYYNKMEYLNIIKTFEYNIKKFFIEDLELKDYLKLNEDNYWKLYIDIFSLGSFGIYYLDLVIQGINKSLINLKLPNIIIDKNKWDDINAIEILPGYNYPFYKTKLGKVLVLGYHEGNIILDLSKEEFNSINVIFVIKLIEDENRTIKIKKIEKLDGTWIDLNLIGKIINLVNSNKNILYNI